ncbi:MAG: ABC transporter permease [Chthoniobacterales bacterium]|nr:ABC transporter permease [Chthoniobacterales bacterium]
MLAGETLRSIGRGRIRVGLTLRQIAEVGFGSQLVVLVTGAFTGAVFTAQAYFQFASLNMETAVGPVVALSMFRELGPVLTGLMVAGRVGAAMTAEIGTMKVTQQIDALRALAVNPVDYLVVPRALAMMLSMPLLVVECVGLGVLASYYVGVQVLQINGVYFFANIQKFTMSSDIMMAVIKGGVFGALIVFISCREGLNAKDGAVGVGRATTATVVTSSLAILVANFFLTMALNIIFPAGQ